MAAVWEDDEEPDESVSSGEQDKIHAVLCLSSFKRFITRAWEIVEPDEPMRWNWHLDELVRVLEQAYAGTLKTPNGDIADVVIVNIPPGTMKSLLINVFFPAWIWAKAPAKRFLNASYDQRLSIRDNLKLRDILLSPWYQRHFRIRLTGDQNAKQFFRNSKSGWRFATSCGGGGTGEHPDVIVLDDPQSAEQAASEVGRATTIAWYKGTISTRGKGRKALTIIVQQRLHEEDLTGYLLSTLPKGSYVHVNFPMHFSPERADLRDHRSKDGELLWPEYLDAVAVRKLEIALQELANAQLEQNPIPPKGSLFQRVWFKPIDLATAMSMPGIECRGWDIAATKDGGDYTVGVKLKKTPDGKFIIMNVVRGQWSPGEVDEVMLLTARMDGRSCRQREEREAGSAGKTVTTARSKLLAGHDYKEVNISGGGKENGKVTRSRPLRAQCEAGNVYIVIGDWTSEYIDEVVKFPFGKHDDQVDGSSCSFNDLTAGPMPVRQVKVRVG